MGYPWSCARTTRQRREKGEEGEEETDEFAVVGRDDLVGGLEETGVDHALHAVAHEVLLVDGLLNRLGDLEHERPVYAIRVSFGEQHDNARNDWSTHKDRGEIGRAHV